MIRIGICGYGNLGKGVEEAIKYSKDMELVAIFSRRDIQTAVPLIKMEDMEQYRKKIDVVIVFTLGIFTFALYNALGENFAFLALVGSFHLRPSGIIFCLICIPAIVIILSGVIVIYFTLLTIL